MEKRKKEAEAAIRERVEREKTAFKLQEILLENDIPAEFLYSCAALIMPSHYTDVVEERAIALMCGYPPCNNSLDEEKYKSKQKYHISLSEKRVYDVTARRLFCSDDCLVSSNLYKSTISEVPLSLRDKKAMPDLAEFRKKRTQRDSAPQNSDHVQRIPISTVLPGDIYYSNPMTNTPEANAITIVERKLDELHIDSSDVGSTTTLAIDGYKPKIEKAATPVIADADTAATINTIPNTTTTTPPEPITSSSSSSTSPSNDIPKGGSEDADYDYDDDDDSSDYLDSDDDGQQDEQEQMMRLFMPKKDPKFSITLTEFGTVWNALTGWCSQRTIRFLESEPGTPPPDDAPLVETERDGEGDDDNGRTLPAVDGITTVQSRLRVLSTTLGRYVVQLKTELRLSASLEQELYQLLSTFNMSRAVGAFTTKQWLTFCLVFIVAVASRNPALKQELSKNKAHLKAALRKHSIREDEFTVFVEVFHGNYTAL